VNVPGSAILPYVNQLVVLAEVFRLIPQPTAAQFEKIRHWFWETAISGYFSGWNTGMMGEDQRAVSLFAEHKSDVLKANISKPSSKIWLKSFRLNNAHSKLLGIVLASQRPKDLLTGQHIDVAQALAWANAKEYHNFFPKEYLLSKGVSLGKINRLANFVLLTSASNKTISKRAPSDYLRDMEVSAGANLTDWLKSNLISQAAYHAAKKDDFELFVSIRAEDIHKAVSQHTNWNNVTPVTPVNTAEDDIEDDSSDNDPVDEL
jgi:hypothetical protein